MNISRRAMLIIGVLMVAAITVGIGYAQGDDQIYACVDIKKGKLRIVDADTECRKKEESLEWSKTGDGADGADGAPGDTGPPGPPGQPLSFYSRYGSTITIPPDSEATATSVCDAEDRTTGGGFEKMTHGRTVRVLYSVPGLGAYTVHAFNSHGTYDATFRAYVVCADFTAP